MIFCVLLKLDSNNRSILLHDYCLMMILHFTNENKDNAELQWAALLEIMGIKVTSRVPEIHIFQIITYSFLFILLSFSWEKRKLFCHILIIK